MANKTFNIVGVSRVRENAPLKLRVANGTKIDNREKVLKRNGHADVFLVMLDTAVDKVGARDFLATNYADLFAQLKPVKDTREADETETETEVVETAVVETAEVVETAVVETEVVETAVVETAVVETAVVETEVVETAVVETEVVETAETEVVDLTPEEKLAARRVRDAARKREKRAAAKAALVNG